MDILKGTWNAAVSKVEALGGTELERKVKEATSNENWGVSSTIKNEIAQSTSDYTVCIFDDCCLLDSIHFFFFKKNRHFKKSWECYGLA